MKDQNFVYLDTSVYLGILLGEALAKPALKLVANRSLCSSTLLVVEAERNLVRMSREKIISAKDFNLALQQLKKDINIFVLKDVSPDLCLTGLYPPVLIPRSNDLIHLRTALWFRDQLKLEGFLTLDKDQAAAASELGLNLLG